MALKPDHVASGLTVAAGVYSMVWATSNGMAPPQAGVIVLVCVVTLPLEFIQVDPKHLMERSWIPRPCRGRGVYCLLLVPLALLMAAGPRQLGAQMGAIYLLSLGLIVQALAVEINCSQLQNRTKQSRWRCVAAELLAGPVVMMMLKAPLRLRMSDWDLIVVLVTVLLAYCCKITLVRRLPLSFTLGESTIIGHGVGCLLTGAMLELGQPVEDATAQPELRHIFYLLQIACVSVMLVMLVLYAVEPLRRTSGFYVLIILVMGMFSMPAVMHLIGDNFAWWILHFVLKTSVRRYLFLYWGGCSLVATLIVCVNTWRLRSNLQFSEPFIKKHPSKRPLLKPKFNQHKNHCHGSDGTTLTRRNLKPRVQENWATVDTDAIPGRPANEGFTGIHGEKLWADQVNLSTINLRKQFHVLAVMVFLPGLVWDVPMLLMAASCALIIFLMLEVVRLVGVWPIAEYLQYYLCVFLDSRDLGMVILTHIYLLLGFTLPLWLNPVSTPNSGVTLGLLSGVLSLGVGDTVASVLGTKIGLHQWPGSQKSVEGTVCSMVFQLLAVDFFMFLGIMCEFSWTPVVLAIIATSLLEAMTAHIDNLILPLYMHILLLCSS